VEDRPGWGELLALAAWLTTLVSIAEMVRYRKDRAEAAARSEAEAVRRRATEERLRIARELHDVVAHNMSLINLQAGVALHLIDQQPDQARASLAVIKDASKDALVELRSILGVLRQVDEEHELAPRSPTSGLAGLDDLVARAEAAGVDVRVDADDVEGIPGHVDLAAYRIIQESLTNVARHSDDTNPLVRVRRSQADLIVEVLDEGQPTTMAIMVDGPPSVFGGYGIAGMRERALALGGHLEAGPRPGQGFAVRAWLPLATDDAGDVETGGLRDHGGPEGRNDEETAR
jgi:signal transduction histidine kinase